mgnify:CR=1 FL=1
MVTRSLVSYDFREDADAKPAILNGHQIIGELRLFSCKKVINESLNGHQIIGELRQIKKEHKGSFLIEWSPDHW